MIDFQTHPDHYRHWHLSFDGQVATLSMDVDEKGGLFDGYELKMNSYDLGVDIELYDAVQRLRFEHPEVRTVVITSSHPKIFCAGANIRMLSSANHPHKVNFCKFTNETRNSIEDASAHSGQRYLCAINGNAAGGGYELALATDYILLIDDSSSTVALPEVPLLAVLPGTGGLTRLVDKRKVRRDLADIFSTTEEGVRGTKAVEWRLADEVAPSSKFRKAVAERAEAMAVTSDRPTDAAGVTLGSLHREFHETGLSFPHLEVAIDHSGRVATLTLKGPTTPVPGNADEIQRQGAEFWPLALARELDDALLHLRLNELEVGTLIFKTEGDSNAVSAYDQLLQELSDNWLVREINLYWKRTLKRVDVTSRTSLCLVEPGSCFTGFLSEFLFAVDRSYMLEGQFEDQALPPADVRLSLSNFGPYPMANGITRLQTRFLGEPETEAGAKELIGKNLGAEEALDAGLVTYSLDDIDWEDEIRLLLEERASFSPDALTGMEANLRFAGPETMETKIFGRLSAWQNWIFQRPNAVGEKGALKCYGTGARPEYNLERV